MKRILMAAAITAALALIPVVMPVTASAAVRSDSMQQKAALMMAPDVVLVNQPASRVCTGNRFTVGVWYQQFSGGSRAYRVLVFNPSGKLILYRRGYASPAAWTFWHVRATRVGNYHTTYKVKNSSGQWSRYRTVTRSHHC
jgi:hypothetical protein